ncbi:ABC transporter ATP-binding protein [Microbacterium oxydans]|uniref:ABC transporter ATP-binding protein n=1 Tax=Microbacterium sp. B19(2022) TaxID=2914045 RepID=UPI001430ADDD|nr:ABC transporter ATP-binding protein [Microbacterium sp. B19(2022)]NJI60352.1 ABC transporter ATP-binding protein [Microbacterium sp. B19(2022)]
MHASDHANTVDSQERKARLRATDLTHHYGSTVALDRLSLTILDGEAVAIMGASGSGKSTLLLVLAGVIRPDSGTVMLHTEQGAVDVAAMADRERSALRLTEFGFVFQDGMLIPELTAAENVSLPLLLNGTGRAEAERTAESLLAELGLGGLGGRRIGQLSGGQAQRVAIARARATNARVIFADEPTGALDSRTASDVLGVLLAATSGQGRSLVVVTHDEDVAARCDRVVRLRDGRIDAAKEASR